jgi:serine/threonine protein phosphatase PrpC
VSDDEFELATPEGIVRFRFSGHSDRGAVRRLNEDSYMAAVPVFVVADGMGGHAHGDRASQAAIAAFADAATDAAPTAPQRVLDTIRRANDAVLAVSAGSDNPGAISGTTLSGVAFVEAGPGGGYHWMAFNVGDSRVYSWDGRTLAQVSVDHSAVQELVDLGHITRLQADHHPDRNIVTRALGADSEVDADIWLLPVLAHQVFIICSDGLTKELSDDEIARIIVFHASEAARSTDGMLVTLAERLANAAIAAGGSDNVTVIVVDSDFAGRAAGPAADDTIDRDGIPGFLEETRPRR